jgi:predicted MFS family arabinose efflux permease
MASLREESPKSVAIAADIALPADQLPLSRPLLEKLAKRFDLAAENRWLFLLALVQFTVVVDHLIMSPLGPQLIGLLHISPSAFGHAVAVYAVSAGISAVAASFYMDRFDRRTSLLVLYAGFAISNLFCGLAHSFSALVISRILAGACGGISSGVVMAMIGDKIPERRRAEATGLVMSAFAAAAIFGMPIGIHLMSMGDWHTPFLALSGVSVLALIALYFLLPSFSDHLKTPRPESQWQRFQAVFNNSNHVNALTVGGLNMLSGIMVTPYLSTFMVQNVGIKITDLEYTYLLAGVCSLISTNMVGRWADRVGKCRAFAILGICSLTVNIVVTHLPHLPFWAALPVPCLFMIFMSGRGVPVTAMITGSVDRRHRGSFMSVNSAVQQFASGVGAATGAFFVSQTADGHLAGYGNLGFAAAAFALLTIILASRIRPVE